MSEIIRYGIVGVLNTIVGYGTYYIGVHYLALHFALATAISQIIGTIHSYIWNRKFTFKSHSKSPWEFVRFASVYGVQYLVNVALTAFFISCFSMSAELGGFLAMCAGVLVSFFGHKFWSFRKF